MFKYFFILIYLISLAYSHADNKDKIIKIYRILKALILSLNKI
jgi:hypothetical protein